MTARKEYRSAVRSRKWIRQAFLDLLQEKEFEKITVTDIVKRADLNRSTFYAHYADIYALVEEIENEILEHSLQLISQLDFYRLFQDPIPFLKTLEIPMIENQEMYRQLGQASFAQYHLEKLCKEFTHHALHAEEVPVQIRQSKHYAIRVRFFIGGIIHIYRQWLRGDLNCSLSEITQDIARTIVSSADMILDAD